MLRRLGLYGFIALAALAQERAAGAQDRDPAAARELLKQGYELKVQKQWQAAAIRLAESNRLDPQSKTLINLAECEEALLHLVDAQRHLVEARDLAKSDDE